MPKAHYFGEFPTVFLFYLPTSNAGCTVEKRQISKPACDNRYARAQKAAGHSLHTFLMTQKGMLLKRLQGAGKPFWRIKRAPLLVLLIICVCKPTQIRGSSNVPII